MKNKINTHIAELNGNSTAENEWTRFWSESSTSESESEISERRAKQQPSHAQPDPQKEELAELALDNWRSKSWVRKVEDQRKTLLKKIEALFPSDQTFWPYNGELIHGPSVRRLLTLGPFEVHEKKHTIVFKSSRHNAFGRVITQYTFEVGKLELGPITKLIEYFV